MKGFVQVYTGNGKGKTTAALGLALRAAGAGLRVYIGQFMKDGDYSEIKALAQLSPGICVEQYGGGCGFIYPGTEKTAHIQAAGDGLRRAIAALTAGKYDVVILDEANVAAYMGLIHVSDILDMIERKPEGTELILTGRNAAPEVLEKADLVTEMMEIKHYFNAGVGARQGIEE